jgi:hypothetical protein
MSINKFLKLTYLTLIILVGQLLLSLHFKEPYPAIMLPGFSSIPSIEESDQMRYSINLYSDGKKTKSCSPEEVFLHQWSWHTYGSTYRVVHMNSLSRSKEICIGNLSIQVNLNQSPPINSEQEFIEYIKRSLSLQDIDVDALDSVSFVIETVLLVQDEHKKGIKKWRTIVL